MQHQPLFGGAMEVCFPSPYTDCSQSRPIPDNQEVFLDSQSQQSFILEILELQNDTAPYSSAVEFHLHNLQSGGSGGLQPIGIIPCAENMLPHLPPHPENKIILAKRTGPEDSVVLVSLIRLQHCGTDLLITFSTTSGEGDASVIFQSSHLPSILSSLQVKHWELFEGSEDNPNPEDIVRAQAVLAREASAQVTPQEKLWAERILSKATNNALFHD